jgi:hypothetical protein
LEDVIWDLFPEDTWAVSNLDKVDATAPTHEWLFQQLAAAAANIGVEGKHQLPSLNRVNCWEL